jgi:hypothetical protein
MFDPGDGALTTEKMSATDLSVPHRSLQLEKLDRLRWPATATVTVFSVRIGLRANVPQLLDSLISRIPSGYVKTGSMPICRLYSVVADSRTDPHQERPDCLLFANGRRLAGGSSWEDLVDSFEADLESFVAAKNHSFLFVHAGAVSWQGQAIIIPGESHSGKTTLVQAFLELGATYYSDEFAVLDSAGQLHPFPRALRVRSNLAFTKIMAANLGAPTAVAPAHVKLVILTKHVPGVCWRPKSLSQGEGILGLMKNTLAARRYPALALSILQRATQGADILGAARGEAKDTAHLAVQHLSR